MFLFSFLLLTSLFEAWHVFSCLLIFFFIVFVAMLVLLVVGVRVCAFYGQDNEPILVLKLVSQLGQCTERSFRLPSLTMDSRIKF